MSASAGQPATSGQVSGEATGQEGAPVAFVTGAARGIGLAVAEWFLAAGHRVAMIDIDGATLSRAAAALGEAARVMAI